MTLLLRVICPDCGHPHDAPLGAEVRCARCGHDYRAQGDGDGASRVVSATPDEMDSVPYSQRSVEVPVNSVSSLIVADPALLYDKLLRDTPLRENARWVGKVRLIKKLGQGGMGAVYRGYDESLALDVAVKILPLPSGARDDQFVQRFRQEARISAKINHSNVVRTLHVDEQGDLIFLVMDYVAGQTARSLVDSKGPLMLPLALQIIHDASLGMQAAHSHGVIHRDIKPDNILIADDGRVLLSDLGLAKAITTGGRSPRMPVTRLGLLLGTPEYMCPEQWEIGAEIGPAADIWAMGATLWMLLTQRPPFEERDTGLLARRIKESPLPDIREIRPNLPDSVLDLLERCMAKKPDERYADAAELIYALNAALDDLAAGRNRITPRPRPRPRQPTPPSVPLPHVNAPAAGQTAAPQQAAVKAMPTPVPVAAPIPARPVRRAWWLAASAAVVAGGWLIHNYLPQKSAQPAAAAQAAVSLDLRYPAHIKPGQEAELTVSVSADDPSRYATVWLAGEKAHSGANLRVALEHDSEFTLVVRDKETAREIARRAVRVAVDLVAHAGDEEFREIVSGTPLKLEGRVQGGAESGSVEARWVELEHPDKPVAEGLAMNVAEKSAFQEPGRYTFVLQVRRSGAANWADAASDRVVVQVSRRVPPEFTAAMKDGSATRQRALAAATGVEALAEWKRALGAFEKACSIADAAQLDQTRCDEAKLLAEQCRQRVQAEEKYQGLLAEGKRLREAAEAAPEADGMRRMTAWSEALRPSTAAAVLFDREEAREQAAAIAARVKDLNAALETAEDERTAFDRLVGKARHSAKEARKYVNAAVALPHWEDALAAFTELSRRFPQRTDEFVLELKEVQESRDKAFLQSSFGVVPARAPEKGSTAAPPKPQETKPAAPAADPKTGPKK